MRPDCMILLADTKPRFRCERVTYGWQNKWRKDAAKLGLYNHWAKGPVLPNSVKVDLHSEHPFRGLWNQKDYPGEIAVMQCSPTDILGLKKMILLMDHFTDRPIANRERLVVVDEGLDFYQRNTLGIDAKRDPILHTARAGGERNIGLLFGAHRPHGIPPLLNTLSSRVTLFHLRFARDMRYLWEMGIPESAISPDGNYIFNQYQVEPGGTVGAPVKARFRLPQSYLDQLSAT